MEKLIKGKTRNVKENTKNKLKLKLCQEIKHKSH